MDSLHRVARGGQVSRTVAEKIMMVITNVNGYRNFFDGHSRAAAAGAYWRALGNHLDASFEVVPASVQGKK
jgi:hypothetical protein